MTVGIVGLGLIGGSMARAYKQSGATVYGADKDESVLGFAKLLGAVDADLDAETIPSCELILLALYPRAAITWLEENAPLVAKSCMVIDLCGTKQLVCRDGFALAEKYGFTFVGGHPMAGTQFSGFKYSNAELFVGAPMVIIPPNYDDIQLFERIKQLLAPAGFGSLTITTAEKHDEMIAFTSQLAHVVSNAYVKSPTAQSHSGFSAGSYRDLTRVAWLNETMWTELFLENRDCLLRELDCIIHSLGEYRDAIAANDADTLKRLLREGREAKEKVDSGCKN